MDEREAKHLKLIIQDEAPSLHIKLREIGNGEWVCVLNAGSLWIWGEKDWERQRNHPDILVKRLIA